MPTDFQEGAVTYGFRGFRLKTLTSARRSACSYPDTVPRRFTVVRER